MTPQAVRDLANWLGSISSIGVIVSLLALQDISQGNEPDLSLEWSVVRIAFVLSIAFHIVALLTLRRSTRS